MRPPELDLAVASWSRESQADLCHDLASTRDRGNTETEGHLPPMPTRWRQGLRDQGKVYGTNLRLDGEAALLVRLPHGLEEGYVIVRVSPRAIRAFIFGAESIPEKEKNREADGDGAPRKSRYYDASSDRAG